MKETIRDFWGFIGIIGVVTFLLVLAIYYQQKSESLEKENVLLNNTLVLCFEGFSGCFSDLKTCIAEKYNITEQQLDLLVNITGRLE